MVWAPFRFQDTSTYHKKKIIYQMSTKKREREIKKEKRKGES